MDTIKKVFVLAGGNDQIELIKGIKKRIPNCEVILIDMNPNVRAREYADRMLVISTMDLDKVLEAAKNEKIDLILSACGDQPLRTMAFVSEKMGLPCYLTFEQAQNLTNKSLMKEKMIEGDIPTSRHISFNINDKINTEFLKYPLVIKPCDNNGSKGIIKIHSENELVQALKEAKKYSLCGDIILEEFKEGEEYSVEAFICQGEPTIIFASKNHKIKDRDTFTICRNEYVGNLDPKLENSIKEIIVKISKTFEIDNVPLLLQLIANSESGEISVIEFSARTGGGSKLFFIREMSGVDIIDNLLDITFGKLPEILPQISLDKAIINYVYTTPGVFSSIENINILEKNNVISAVYQYKSFGSKILSSNYSSDRAIGVLIKGKNSNEIDKKIQLINNTIKILDEDGNDIMRHDIFAYNQSRKMS